MNPSNEENFNNINDNIIEINNNCNIFRYKFTQEFMDIIYEFSKIHQYDDRKIFKESWEKWVEENEEIIDNEEKRLKSLSYDGNVKEKMFKSARYYFRKKSTVKKEAKKRREYISIDKNLLRIIDEDITTNMRIKELKPSEYFENFSKERDELIKDELLRMVNMDIRDEDLIKEKIKKTYKNRYFILTNGCKKSKESNENQIDNVDNVE
jgi:hypothetical protein